MNVKDQTMLANTFYMANYHMREFIGVINIIAGHKKITKTKKKTMVWYSESPLIPFNSIQFS